MAALETQVFDYAFYVVMLDRRTRPVQDEIKRLLANRDSFVLGIAIEEIEAWWLADRQNALAWSGLQEGLPDNCRYAQKKYSPERDNDPKKTLDELTRCSDEFDRYYGEGSVDLASDFAENYWKGFARLDNISRACPKGFRPFQRAATQKSAPRNDKHGAESSE